MSDRPAAPPPVPRPDLTQQEITAIRDAVGPVPHEHARPLRDGRGREFQRLEFLGDSVLDLLLAVHSVVEPTCRPCREVGGVVARLVTDHQLARRAAVAGVGVWLEWEASAERLADLVEACAAAAWRSGGWDQVGAFASRVVHPLSRECVLTVLGRCSSPVAPTDSRAERRLGAAVLELAAAQTVFLARPEFDEGELSRQRALLHRSERVAAYARRTGAGSESDVAAELSDRVESQLAAQLLSSGADAALATAVTVLAPSGSD